MTSGSAARRRRAALARRIAEVEEVATGFSFQGYDRHRRAVWRYVVDPDPLQVIADIRRGRAWLTELEKDAVVGAAAAGFTWAELGQVLGVSAQAAHARWSGRTEAALAAAAKSEGARGAPAGSATPRARGGSKKSQGS